MSPPPPTISVERARTPTRLFQRLHLTSRHDLSQEPLSRQSQPRVSKRAIDSFYRTAKSYYNASQHALNELAASAALTQEEVDVIWSKHCMDMENLVEYEPDLSNCLKTTVLDSSPKCQKAWLMMRAGHHNIDTLNGEDYYRRLRDEVARQMALIRAFCNYRLYVLQDRLARARRAVIWFHAQQVNSFDAQTERADWAHNHATRWWRVQWMIDEELKALKRKTKPLLHAHLAPEHSDMAAGTALEREIDELIDRMHREAFPSWGDQEEEEEANDGPKELPVLTEDDIAELKASLGYATPIIIDTRTLKDSPALSLLTLQLLDKDCSICMASLDTPCEIKTCHHVFCFECIVRWVHPSAECPKCRRHTVMNDLRLLDVTKTNAGTGVNGKDIDETDKRRGHEDEDNASRKDLLPKARLQRE